LLQGYYDGIESDIVYIMSHEISHMLQVYIMNDQLGGIKTDLGIMLITGNKMQVKPSEVYGLYMTNPLEYHANSISDRMLKTLQDKGVIK
jgi:filamentous hemagglutinin